MALKIRVALEYSIIMLRHACMQAAARQRMHL